MKLTPTPTPTPTSPPTESGLSHLIDEQLELAAAKLPALDPALVHPSIEDHDESPSGQPTLEDVLLGIAEPTPEMLETLAALEAAPELSDEELARQALAAGGADNDALTPE